MSHVIKLEKKLICDMEEYFRNPKFSDCFVESREGYRFQLHRIVLAKCSEVFKILLSTETKEDETCVIEVGTGSGDLRRLFELIYTGETTYKISQDLTGLILAANKYKISEIEDLCADKLIEIIKPWNAVQVLHFSYYNKLKSSKKIKEKALDCIGKNFAHIRKSFGWMSLMMDHDLMTMAVDAYIFEKEPKHALIYD